MVLTLTKRRWDHPLVTNNDDEDEQLHVLPHYSPANRDKSGQITNLGSEGGLEVLEKFQREILVVRKDLEDGDEGFDPRCKISRQAAYAKLVASAEAEAEEYCNSSSEQGSEFSDIVREETDCLDTIRDLECGGLALRLTHGSILFEVARRESHASTALKKPNR